MPGAYFDSQASGVHPNVFRPPLSPSVSSSVYLAKSTGSVQSEATTPATHAKRKRIWNGSSQEQHQPDAAYRTDDTHGTAPLDHDRNQGHYMLAGQLETPGGFQADGEHAPLEDSAYSDYDYRRALGSKRSDLTAESPSSGQPTVLIKPVQPINTGWSRTAFSTIGGVVGKVWDFCTAGAFKGFYAGGGTGYSFNGAQSDASPQPDAGDGKSARPPEDYFSQHSAGGGEATPVPGGFPQQDYVPYPLENAQATTPESTPSRPTKRRQISGNDELLKNWVMVDESSSAERTRPGSRVSSRTPGRATPSRNTRPSITTGRRISVPVSRLNSTPGPMRRSSHRISHAGSPALSPREPASFAGARSSRPPSPGPLSPSRIPVPVQTPGRGRASFTAPRPSSAAAQYRTSGITSPGPRPSHTHRRTHSGASAASARGQRDREEDGMASPRLTDEAKRLAAKRRREEKDADLRMNDFNARLQAMIRQGKEALGTQIEVEGEGAAGWESDD